MKKAGTAVVILNDQDEVLILLRTKEARWAPLRWGYPGGKVEPGETPQAAAVRETKEETELEVDKLTPFEANIGGLENFENKNFPVMDFSDQDGISLTFNGPDFRKSQNFCVKHM